MLERVQVELAKGATLFGRVLYIQGSPPITVFGFSNSTGTYLEVGCEDTYTALCGLEEALGGNDFSSHPIYRLVDRWFTIHSSNDLDITWVHDKVIVVSTGVWRTAVKQVITGGSRNYKTRVVAEGVGDTLLNALADLFQGETHE